MHSAPARAIRSCREESFREPHSRVLQVVVDRDLHAFRLARRECPNVMRALKIEKIAVGQTYIPRRLRRIGTRIDSARRVRRRGTCRTRSHGSRRIT